MLNTQQYLNKLDKTITELDLSNQNLLGHLIIQDFPNLENIKCGNNNLTSLELTNLPKLNYFHANGCQIANLTINECPQINEFNIANNLLTSTEFLTNLNSTKLTHLSIHSNNFTEQDLSFLSKFTNLEKLFVDNHSKEKLNNNIYNRFTDSLQPLQNLTNLKWVNIANTDISSGLEYLPASLKKICLINSWELKEAGYLKIKWEMERSVRFPKVTQKLIQEEKDEPPFVKDWYRLAPWREAKKLHGEEIFKRQNAQTWLDKTYPPHTNRQHYREIIMTDKNVVGELNVTGFTGLEKLDCSYNQLTSLNLTDCLNLIELNCSNNEFTNTGFLSQMSNPEKLEKLNLNKNQELKENLDFLTPFTNLKELNLSNCPLTGSLEPLKNTNELRTINLTNTDIDSGLDYLSDSCRELYCDHDSKKKSVKLANILTKHLEERSTGQYYNLVKWREELRSNIVLSIPTERLFVIRSNIKKFVKKWGGEAEDKLYERFVKSFLSYWKGQPLSNLNELSKLQTPEQFRINWYWTIPQWGGRLAIGISGILSFYDYQVGAVALASPLVETATSYAKQNLYKEHAEKWEEFTQDATELLDNYHELVGILKSLRGYKIGKEKLDGTLEELDNKSKKFLEVYDEAGKDGQKDGVIDLFELQKGKTKLAHDLNKERTEEGSSQLGDIAQTIIQLEEEINKYRRGFYYGASEETKKSDSENEQEQINDLIDIEEDEEGIRLYPLKAKREQFGRSGSSLFPLLRQESEASTSTIALETRVEIPPK